MSAGTRRGTHLVLTATSINVVLVFVGASSVNVLLPEITRTFAATPTQASWFVLGYQLVMTSLIVVFGRLADIFGRKLLYVAGVVVFVAASLAAGLVPGAGWFVLARLLQGLGAAAVVGNTTAILTDVFPAHRLGHALGVNATSAGLGQVLGPVVAGLLSEAVGWRWLFLGIAPVALLSLLVSLRFVPSRRPAGARERVDLPGVLTFASSLSAFSLAMSLGPARGWGSPATLALLGAAVVVFALFLLRQSRARSPLVDLSLFRVPGLASRYLAVLLCALSQYAVVILLSQYLQATGGLSVLDLSLLVLWAPVASMTAAMSAGPLIARFGSLRLAATGMVLIGLASSGLLVLVALGRASTLAPVPLALLGAGVGLFMTPNTSLIMTLAPAARRGVANAVRSTLLNVGNLLIVAVGLAVSTGPLDAAGRAALYSGDFPLSGAQSAALGTGTQVALGLMTLTAAVAAVLSLRRPAGLPAIAFGGRAATPRPTAPDGAPAAEATDVVGERR